MPTKTRKTATTRPTPKAATPAGARSTSTTSRTPATSARTRAKSATGSVTAKARKAVSTVTKRVGDVLGIGRARVPDDVPRATSDRGGARRKTTAATDRRKAKTTGRPMRVKM
jgi:hypothetical protein